VDGGAARSITVPRDPGYDAFPAFSSDGSRLAYSSCEKEITPPCDVYVANLTGDYQPNGPARQVTRLRGPIHGLAWAPDERSIVFALASPLTRTRLLHWIDRDPRVAAVRTGLVGNGLWVMFLLRLSPLVPYVLLNYALAVSGVRYRDFLVAAVGITLVCYGLSRVTESRRAVVRQWIDRWLPRGPARAVA